MSSRINGPDCCFRPMIIKPWPPARCVCWRSLDSRAAWPETPALNARNTLGRASGRNGSHNIVSCSTVRSIRYKSPPCAAPRHQSKNARRYNAPWQPTAGEASGGSSRMRVRGKARPPGPPQTAFRYRRAAPIRDSHPRAKPQDNSRKPSLRAANSKRPRIAKAAQKCRCRACTGPHSGLPARRSRRPPGPCPGPGSAVRPTAR